MNFVPPRLHGILDYGGVVFLLLAPELLFPAYLGGGTAWLCYALAAALFTMTLLTDFPLGMSEVIPLGVHGVIELVAALALVVLPWIAPVFFAGAQWLFTLFGLVLFVVWLLTDYSGPRAASKTSPPRERQRAEAPDSAVAEDRPLDEEAPRDQAPRDQEPAQSEGRRRAGEAPSGPGRGKQATPDEQAFRRGETSGTDRPDQNE